MYYVVDRAFTLLEMLVVLLILGLIAGLAMPRLVTLYDRLAFALERDDVLAYVNDQGWQAYRAGQDLVLSEIASDTLVPSDEHASLPPGWQLSAEPAIRYSALGVCSGGLLTLRKGDYSEQHELSAPRCQIR